MREPREATVAVPGGTLHAFVWDARDPGAPAVVAVHGITATHRSFSLLAEELDGAVTLIAPDLRGRGASNGVTGPFGLSRHADDLIATLDALGVESVTFAGHSMGGFVVPLVARSHPDRVASLVVLDGGMKMVEPSAGESVEQVVHRVIGPSLERLKMTFPSRHAYREFWLAHPAMAADWNEHIERYIDYDLIAADDAFRSGVSLEAVLADGAGTLDRTAGAIYSVRHPMVFVRALRGVMNETPGLYDERASSRLRERVPQVEIEAVDANHFGLVLGSGAPCVAEIIRKAAGA